MSGSCGPEDCGAELVLNPVPEAGDVGVGIQPNPSAKPFFCRKPSLKGLLIDSQVATC